MLRVLQPFLEMFREALLQTGDQAVLGAEMIEKSALADIGQVSDGIQRQAPNASGANQLLGSVQDTIADG